MGDGARGTVDDGEDITERSFEASEGKWESW